MENDPFIDDFPIKTTIDRGFSMAMLNNQRVIDQEIGNARVQDLLLQYVKCLKEEPTTNGRKLRRNEWR